MSTSTMPATRMARIISDVSKMLEELKIKTVGDSLTIEHIWANQVKWSEQPRCEEISFKVSILVPDGIPIADKVVLMLDFVKKLPDELSDGFTTGDISIDHFTRFTAAGKFVSFVSANVSYHGRLV